MPILGTDTVSAASASPPGGRRSMRLRLQAIPGLSLALEISVYELLHARRLYTCNLSHAQCVSQQVHFGGHGPHAPPQAMPSRLSSSSTSASLLGAAGSDCTASFPAATPAASLHGAAACRCSATTSCSGAAGTAAPLLDSCSAGAPCSSAVLPRRSSTGVAGAGSGRGGVPAPAATLLVLLLSRRASPAAAVPASPPPPASSSAGTAAAPAAASAAATG